jgi:hypothetical protein
MSDILNEAVRETLREVTVCIGMVKFGHRKEVCR